MVLSPEPGRSPWQLWTDFLEVSVRVCTHVCLVFYFFNILFINAFECIYVPVPAQSGCHVLLAFTLPGVLTLHKPWKDSSWSVDISLAALCLFLLCGFWNLLCHSCVGSRRHGSLCSSLCRGDTLAQCPLLQSWEDRQVSCTQPGPHSQALNVPRAGTRFQCRHHPT